MTIQFYKIADVANKINKAVPDTPDLTIQGTLKDRCSLLDPTVTIESSGVPDYNYAYIPEFGRYYFIAPATNLGAVLWSMSMHVDVLYTYRQQIMTAPCIVAKSSSSYNLYLNDSNYKCYSNPHIFCENWPGGFDVTDAKFVMTLFGDKVLAT